MISAHHHAANLEQIVAGIRERGSNVPVVADIHFKPDAALEAVKWVEMVRVNPGNYADSKKFASHEYTEEEYAEELVRIEEEFGPLVDECKRLNRAMRIGTNHGSLSDRIMNRYGDTPLGMVESALEFARIARDRDFHNFKFSMKSSNPKVMVECYRLLAARLADLGPDWNYPLHLGVTEAGEGEDALEARVQARHVAGGQDEARAGEHAQQEGGQDADGREQDGEGGGGAQA